MKWISVAALVASTVAMAGPDKIVKHKVTEAETAWFLASLYYGSGLEFPKLLSANHLQRPEEMKEGMEIQVVDPKFSEDQAGFSERYKRLWQVRQAALGLTVGSKLPNSNISIPAENIRHRDRTPTLPFSELNERHQSAAELARKELHIRSQKDSQGRD